MVNMADIKAIKQGLFLRPEELRRGIELMFFAYRDFTAEADRMLADLGLGRAHHRVLHFVARQPGITISELLAILNITKQSLNRVLSHLMTEEYVRQETGAEDRRQRLLYLTQKGAELEADIASLQSRRFATAYRESGAAAVAGFHQVLQALLDEDAQAILTRLEADSSGERR